MRLKVRVKEKQPKVFKTPYLQDLVELVEEKSPNRLIFREKEYVRVVRCKDCKYSGKWFGSIYCSNFADDVTKAQPTVDAVSVVRCKDCKYAYWNEQKKWYFCYAFSKLNENDYCSQGERKNDG